MLLPHPSTRTIASLALFASLVSLVFSLAHNWSAPHAPARTALAAAPKTELADSFTNRDPAAARAYYLAILPEDLTTYTHPVYGFSFTYFKDFTVLEIEDEQSELVLIENSAMGMGFQIFITPDEDASPLTAERIRHDLPDMPMEEVVEFTLADETAAVRFVSHDPGLGEIGETWFRKEGHVYQLSVVAPDRELQDAWLREIAANLTFPSDNPDGGMAP
jgi:hypothetical protein